MTQQTVKPTPPHNVEAEEALLGSLLVDPEAIPRVAPILGPEDFYVRRNGWVYEAVLALQQRHEPVDFLTLCGELERKGRLEEIGGQAYIARLVEAVPTALHAEAYARRVREAAVRRRMLEAAVLTARLAHDLDTPLDEALSRIESVLLDLRGRIPHQDRLQPLSRLVPDLYDAVEQYHLSGQPPGIPTGLPDLDRLLGGGLRDGTLNIVASRPGVGKSALLTGIGLHAARSGLPTAFFSLEMSTLEVLSRIVQLHTGLDLRHCLDEEEWARFVDAAGRLSDLPLFLDDTPDLSVADLRAKALRLALDHGLRLLLVDYVQLARAPGRFDSRYLEVGAISRALKHLAQELRIPVVAAAQLGRGAEGRRPTLADLRESGNLEADADTVLLLHPVEEAADLTSPMVETAFILAKHRSGPTGSFHLLFHRAPLRFYPIVREEGTS